MGVSEVLRGSFGFLLDRHHDNISLAATSINVTPANALQSLFRRQREAPLPITPVSIFRSMLQLEDIQALLWAWTLVAILLLFAYSTNPSESSFRPFLTDLVFRERLRLLNDQDAAESHAQNGETNGDAVTPSRKSDGKTFSSMLSNTAYPSTPFALTFGSKVALSVRTPPFNRRDLGLLSIVTISQSMPLRSADHVSATATVSSGKNGTVDCTSLFIGAFGKWWVCGFGIPDLPSTRSQSVESTAKSGREELEENLTDVTDWGVIEMRAVDPDVDHRRDSTSVLNNANDDLAVQPSSRRASAIEPAIRSASPAPSPTTKDVAAPEADSEDCLSITALVSRSQSDIADLHDQLAQLKSASTRTCEALENDLEEVRARKKEEEKSRSEIKTRTKALDDSKRQVESSRREAERRLKAANTARTLKQASINSRKEQIESLNKRRTAIISRKANNDQKRHQRSDELTVLISQSKEKAESLRGDIEELRQEVQAAQELLQMEKINARNAQEGGYYGGYAHADPYPYMWNPAMEANHLNGHDAMYAHLASNQDPLVDKLARMEERDLAGQRFTPSPFEADAPPPPMNKLQHTDAYADLGTSVLRNAFRRANAAAGADGREMMPSASTGLLNPSLQNASNFEAIKQAFQPTVATEEDGRRSWSAFDVWQSDLRSGGRQRMQWSSGGGNASADSLPHFNASSGFLPLDRASSAEQTGLSSSPGSTDADGTRNLSKVKKAFRWPFRPSQVQDELV